MTASIAPEATACARTRIDAAPLLAIDHLSKTFPGETALNDVSLRLLPGEIHALVGQNGSGKSTLVKVLSGYHVPDDGAEVELFGEAVTLPFEPTSSGRLHFVHQDLGLIDSLDTLDNFALGAGYTGRTVKIDWRDLEARARRALDPFHIADIDVRVPVGRLPAWQRAVVAIARGLSGWQTPQGILVLDETTAALPHTEAEILFEAIRTVASAGAAVLYITHRLDEVFALTDRVSVLRNGRLVGTHVVETISKSFLIGEMVGAVTAPTHPDRVHHEAIRLRLDNVHAERLCGVSMALRGGEIVGVAGLFGSGREVLADVVCGVLEIDGGGIEVDGKRFERPKLTQLQRHGLAFVPNDRKTRGLFPHLSSSTNMTISDVRSLWRRGRIDVRRERRDVERWIGRFSIKPDDPDRPIGTLSGGNQQKVMLARALRLRPTVLVLDEPTQGVDVGAKRAIYALIEEAAAEGMTVLLCTAEPEDLPDVCDRVLVLRRGRVGAELAGERLTVQHILEEVSR